MRKQEAAAGILVDTNLLVLYIVGLYKPGLITAFKRTRQYTAEDFGLVARAIKFFRQIIVTPQMLAELTNLLGEREDKQVSACFRVIVVVLQRAGEQYLPKNRLLTNDLLPRLGFTDLSILEAAKEFGYSVLTDDFVLHGKVQKAGCRAINLNHLRQMVWSQ
jgi:rRNA-processing protein FCF1